MERQYVLQILVPYLQLVHVLVQQGQLHWLTILILDFQSQNNNDRGSSSDYFSGKADWEDGYTSISSAQIGPGVIIQNQGHLQLGDVDYLMEKSTDALTSGSMWTTRGANNNGGGYAVFEQKAGTIDITNNFKMAGFFIKENGDLTAGSMLNEEGIFIQQDGYTTIVGEFKNQYDRDEEWTHRWIVMNIITMGIRTTGSFNMVAALPL